MLSKLDVTMALDSFADGKLEASVRPGSVGVGVGAVNTAIPGLVGWILDNVVVPIAQGPLRSFVASQLSGFVTSNVGAAIGNTLGGFNLPAVGASFPVPSLSTPKLSTPLSINFAVSSVSRSPAGILIGLSSGFSMPAKHSRPSLGAEAGPRDTGPGRTGDLDRVVHVDVAARVTVKPPPQGNALEFQDLTLTDLHFATRNVAIGQSQALVSA